MPAMDETELRIWPRHLYSVPFSGRKGYCAAGSRQWFCAYGLSWSDFVANGIDASALTKTGDPLAVALVEHAKNLEMKNGR